MLELQVFPETMSGQIIFENQSLQLFDLYLFLQICLS